MQDQKIYTTLMLAGAIPFVACALLPFVGIEEFGRFGRLDELAISYGVAILCFLTGVHWATQLHVRVTMPFNLFILSNTVFLTVWVMYVSSGSQGAIAAQLLAFPLLLGVDIKLSGRDLISRHYLRMRFIATALACVSLIFILIF